MHKNIINERRQAALPVIHHWIEKYSLDAAAFQGGIVRGTLNEDSDVDVLIVTGSPERCEEIPKGEGVFNGIKIGTYFLDFSKATPSKWNDKQRYVYCFETEPIYDPLTKLNEMMKQAALTIDEIVFRSVKLIRKLSKKGISYEGLNNENWRGFNWSRSADYWIDRGEWLIANLQINMAVNDVFQLLYTLNGRPIPSNKYFYYNIRFLPWLPAKLTERIQSISQNYAATNTEYKLKSSEMISILTEIIDEIDSRGLLPPDMKEYYYRHIFSYHDNTDE
ncbi:nucleotidyltransferase domain-containing protein [Paenibacillus alkalitolerans]|uniref:nucleotidyltransferase domain-containing protein n=1 Tax=Paenibacillus alkalitolerans TaxID=2799335 RepID=UPI0018F37E4B|nr:nucleotidyltransferase domain-containing protein [Paenibacillus alkalitolerans]